MHESFPLDAAVVVRWWRDRAAVVLRQRNLDPDAELAVLEVDQLAVHSEGEVHIGRATVINIGVLVGARDQHRVLDPLGPVRRQLLEIPEVVAERETEY